MRDTQVERHFQALFDALKAAQKQACREQQDELTPAQRQAIWERIWQQCEGYQRPKELKQLHET